jgi:hypothetical protein
VVLNIKNPKCGWSGAFEYGNCPMITYVPMSIAVKMQ